MDTMKEDPKVYGELDRQGLICCAMCRHFSYFENKAGHNSPHALGRCAVESWDGNQGQWAMFQHQCRNFAEALPPPMP